MTASPQVTQLLVAWTGGDAAALDELVPLVERELHRLAVHHMAGERPGHVLQATALVNEAFLRLVTWKDPSWQNRAHFYAMAAQIMRRVLVDMARRRRRSKRDGSRLRVSLSEALQVPAPAQSADLGELDEALKRLAAIDPRKSRVVEMRFFGGLSLEEVAYALGVSLSTARRDWSLARAWLSRELSRAR